MDTMHHLKAIVMSRKHSRMISEQLMLTTVTDDDSKGGRIHGNLHQHQKGYRYTRQKMKRDSANSVEQST